MAYSKLYIFTISYSHHIHIIFTSYSHHILIIFESYSHHILIIFESYSNYIRIIFTSYSNYIRIIFTSYSNYILIISALLPIYFRSTSALKTYNPYHLNLITSRSPCVLKTIIKRITSAPLRVASAPKTIRKCMNYSTQNLPQTYDELTQSAC